MLKVLYGNLKISKKTDYVQFSFKVVYIIYTIPFLLFVFLMYLGTVGAFGNPLKEKFGLIKKILIHFSAIAMSSCAWILILGILEEKLNIKVRFHL